MIKAIYSAFLLFVLAYSTATAQTTFSTAIAYNDFIVAEQDKIGELIGKFNAHIEAGNYTEARTLLTGEMTKQANSSIATIKKMQAWKGDITLRNTAIDLFQFYANCFSKQYPEMLDIVAKGAAITTADSDRLNKILDEVVNTEKGYDDAFQNAQTAFAEKNGFTLSE